MEPDHLKPENENDAGSALLDADQKTQPQLKVVDFAIAEEPSLVGKVLLERYQIIAEVGSGGMGKVYKAKHDVIGKDHAIKVLHRHLVGETQSLQRFQVEAKAASTLKHVNLLTVTDYGLTESKQPFLVMDYVEGESLAQILAEKGKLSTSEFVEIFQQVCEGLAHAHKKNIIHRDIKPSNIMITRTDSPNESVRIVDFGIAKIIPGSEDVAQHLTQTGEIFGSPLYMSPEQCRGGKIDCRSDIYSLGCVMFESLTGHVPIQGPSAIETLFMHINQPAKPISQVHPELEIPFELEAIVSKALAINPDERYQSIEQLQEDLSVFKFHSKLPPTARASLSKSPSKSRSNVQKLIALFLGFVLLGVGGYAFNSYMTKTKQAEQALKIQLQEAQTAKDLEANKDKLARAAEWTDLAWKYSTDGSRTKAMDYATKAMDLRERVAPNTQELAESLNQVAWLSCQDLFDDDEKIKQDVADKAEAMYKRAIAMVKDDHGHSLEEGRLKYMRNLADLYMDESKYDLAAPLLHEAESAAGHELYAQDVYDSKLLAQLARLYWATNRSLDAAKIEIGLAVPSSRMADLSTTTTDNLAGEWRKSAGDNDDGFGITIEQKGKTLTGTLSCTTVGATHVDSGEITGEKNPQKTEVKFNSSFSEKPDDSGKSELVRVGDYLVWHEISSIPGSYFPTTAVLSAVEPEPEKK